MTLNTLMNLKMLIVLLVTLAQEGSTASELKTGKATMPQQSASRGINSKKMDGEANC